MYIETSEEIRIRKLHQNCSYFFNIQKLLPSTTRQQQQQQQQHQQQQWHPVSYPPSSSLCVVSIQDVGATYMAKITTNT